MRSIRASEFLSGRRVTVVHIHSDTDADVGTVIAITN